MISVPGDNPAGHVVSLNLHRRHLDTSQRAMVAARIANLNHGQRADYSAESPIGDSATTQDEAATMLNVGKRSVERARTVLEDGSPELVEAEPQAQSVTVVTALVTDTDPAKPQKQPLVTVVTDVTGNRPGGPTRNDHG